MSLEVWTCDPDILQKHFDGCDTPLCETCVTALERWREETMQDMNAREQEQDIQLDEYERAELRREQGLCDYDSDDMRTGEPSRG